MKMEAVLVNLKVIAEGIFGVLELIVLINRVVVAHLIMIILSPSFVRKEWGAFGIVILKGKAQIRLGMNVMMEAWAQLQEKNTLII